MPKIQLLDRHVAELIAAGEVVERPSSVVKELMENAIDAGATAVTVEIESGGIRSIRITDNGCGIAREDVPTAFLRHATSKVRTEEDLENIGTLGFRGEALASISAVARVELVTRTAQELAGTCCRIEGGGEPEITDVGCPEGTTIYVRDLFYNVPARMKFLKKDVSEANAVASVVECLALSHPEIAIRFVRDGKEALHTPGDSDARACIYSVFGREFANNLLPVDYRLGDVHVYGFICTPVTARSNRAMQHFFVNGRYVKTRTAAAALERGFQGAIMVGKFPACVLHLDMPAATVDANVHPAKIEIRFVNERPVFDAVFHAVKSALLAEDKPKQATLAHSPVMQQPAEQLTIAVTEPVKPAEPAKPAEVSVVTTAAPKADLSFRDRTTLLFGSPDISVSEPAPTPKAPEVPRTEPVPVPSVQEAPKTVPPVQPEAQEAIAPAEEAPVHYLGEVYRTYLIAEKGGSLYFVDKHAAHERIIYNKLCKAIRSDAQILLSPVTVSLSHKECEALLSQQEALNAAGFEIEDFDGALLVRSVPMMLTGEDVPALMQEIAAGFLSGRQEVTVDKLSWIYHSVACKAAVKAGDRQSVQELEALAIRVLSDDEVRYCPHGRPVCFELTRKELEKQFGRLG